MKLNKRKYYIKMFLLVSGLMLLGFYSCKAKPKTKYGPPPSDYKTTENLK